MTNTIVVFDFGDVLFNIDTKGMFHDRFLETGRTRAEADMFLTQVFTKTIRSMSNKGALAPVLHELAGRYPQYADDILAFSPTRDFMKQVRGATEGMPDVLRDIKEAGIPLYGLTNWSSDGFAALTTTYPDVIKIFDKIVVSGDVKMRKPDPDIFQLAHKTYKAPEGSRILYFDDKPTNTKAASDAVGWEGHVFQNAATTRKIIGL